MRGHSSDQRILQTGKKNVGIKLIEPVGNYAIRIAFDDGHDSGIYAWPYLHELSTEQEQFWQEYLQKLKQANVTAAQYSRESVVTQVGVSPPWCIRVIVPSAA